MIVVRIAWLLAFAMACGAACEAVQPPTGPGTEYPCGIHGLSCGGGWCCNEGDLCGFDGDGSRCPAGYCCWEGTEAVRHRATRAK